MGCVQQKDSGARRQETSNQGSTNLPASQPYNNPAGEEDEVWQDDPNGDDELINRELWGVKVNKNGVEVGMYDRAETRPEEPQQFTGMFEMESVGAGDQAMAVKPWIGQISPPDYPPEMLTGPPSMNLNLEYIYGYRCFDTRQNIFYTSQPNEIVYMAAAVGICMNTQYNSQRFMGAGESKQANGHTDDITALCVHPDKEHIATGEVGKNPKVIVWSSRTMQPVNTFRNGRDSRGITAMAFSKDGTHLASCALDNDHTVRVWNWAQGSKVFEGKGGPDKILDANFSPVEDTLLTVGIKHIYFWSKAQGWGKKKGIFGKVGTMCTMTACGFLSNGCAVTGGSNGSIYLWNGNRCAKMVNIHKPKAACHTLNVVNDSIYAGGSDKTLHVLDPQLNVRAAHQLSATPRAVDAKGNNIIVGCINGDIVEISGQSIPQKVMESHCDGEVWGLDVNLANRGYITTAGDDNMVRTWDIMSKKCVDSSILDPNKGQVRRAGYGASTLAATSPNQQARCVAINDHTGHVALGFNDGSFEIRAGMTSLDQKITKDNQIRQWIEVMHFSPNGQWLAIGSHDCNIYIFNTQDYRLHGRAQKHSSYITALDWSYDSKFLKSCCGAYELLYWTVDESGRLSQMPDGRSALKNEQWSTYTTHFGWHVNGIFRGVIDMTHVNRVDRDPRHQFFAVANDWGLVEIFNSPNNERSQSKQYRGHSEHVTNVKFTDTHVFSAGGYDQCIMQWLRS